MGVKIPKPKGAGIRKSVRERTFETAAAVRKASNARSAGVFVMGIEGEPDCFGIAVGAEDDEIEQLRKMEALLTQALDKTRAFLTQAEAGQKPTVINMGPDRRNVH